MISRRQPMTATIDITNYCNFKCKHCYVSSMKFTNQDPISTNEWTKILDILKQKGVIYLIFTGGEILTYKSFLEIYQYAYKLNFKIKLLTNISLLNVDILDIFKKFPPGKISITLYGASNKTYSIFCGIQNGWDIVKNNIVELKKANQDIEIKTILNRYNYSEIEAMSAFANKKTYLLCFIEI